MPLITGIKATKRDATRLTVRVDGRVVATLPRAQIDLLGLQPGRPWDDDLIEQVERAVEMDKAHRQALSLLNRRAYSRMGLARKLRLKGYDAKLLDPILDRLTELGLLDDRAFGQAIVRELLRARPAGRRLIEAKLRQRGLDASLARELADEADEQSDPLEAARRLLQARAPSLARLEQRTQRRRLWGLLARRGFDPDIISQAMNELPETDSSELE
jgi:regulatory protein